MKQLYFLVFICLVFMSCDSESPDSQESEANCDNGTFVGEVNLSTQTEVDSFGAQCYSKINGRLSLFDAQSTDDRIHDLTPLLNLNEVFTSNVLDYSGSLTVRCSELETLNGLENITAVGGLNITDCNSLISLEGLEGLTSVERTRTAQLRIIRNNVLENLDGLNQLIKVQSTEDNFSLLQITENPSLTQMNALENLNYVNGLLKFYVVLGTGDNIYFNENVTNYCGIRNLLISETYTGIDWMSEFFNSDEGSYVPSIQDIIDGNCSQ